MIASAPALTSTQRLEFLELIDRRFGIRSSAYGMSHVEDAVQRVLPLTRFARASELLESIDDSTQPSWLYALVEHLTIGETYFLRDDRQVAAFRGTVLPDVVARRAQERCIRVWSAGCSTGEEVYTLAMLLLEAGLARDWDISLVGTDINRDSLRAARDAVYPARSFRMMPDVVRDRYFQASGSRWRAVDRLRTMARFAWLNLGAEPLLPPAYNVDVIVCRNVTIYFDDTATQRLYQALVSSLSPGGWLVLGPSDPLPTDRARLERVDASGAVLWRRLEKVRSAEHPVTPPRTPLPPTLAATRRRRVPSAIHDDVETGLLALESGSAGVAVDHLRRATFLDPTNTVGQFALGRAYLNLGDVQHGLAALEQAQRLLAPLSSDQLVPGTDSMQVEAMRQAVRTYMQAHAA